MPNHVHVLFSPAEGEVLEKLVGGWKNFTARRINRILGQEGKLWQKNYSDLALPRPLCCDDRVEAGDHFLEFLRILGGKVFHFRGIFREEME